MNKITVDIGTTTIKCALFKGNTILKSFAKEYGIVQKGLSAEQNPQDWWDIACEGIRAVAPENGDNSYICISSQGITVLPVDDSGVPMGSAVSWLDRGAEEYAQAIERHFGRQRIFDITGKHLAPSYTMPKIMRLKAGGIKAFKYLMPLDYLGFKLTGRYVTDYTMASGTMLFDIHNKRYSKELLDFCGITEADLADVLPMGSTVGSLTAEAAEKLALPQSTSVVLGGQDQKLSAIACELDGETACVSIGTSTAISTFTGQGGADFSVFRLDDERLIYEAVVGTSGAVIKWYKNTFNIKSYAEMDRLAEGAGGSFGVVFDVMFSRGGGISGLKLGTETGNIIYALYEGIATEIKKRTVPYGIKKLVVSGGGAKSNILLNIIAGITGCTVVRPETDETALLGAAKLIGANYKIVKQKIQE